IVQRRTSSVQFLSILVVAISICVFPSVAQQSTPPASRIALRIIVVDSIQQADQILERLKKGESFAALAAEKSTDATGQNGGLMGKVDVKVLRSELREALKVLKPGDIRKPIKLLS